MVGKGTKIPGRGKWSGREIMFARHAGAMASSPALVACVVAQSVASDCCPGLRTACDNV